MNTVKKFLKTGKKVLFVLPGHIVNVSNKLFLFLVLAMAVGLVICAGAKVYTIYRAFIALSFNSVLYDAVFLIVFVKAFYVLLQCYYRQYVSIKQILEVAIVALIVNVAFAFETRDLWMNVMLGAFALGNLITYLIFYDKLVTVEKNGFSKGTKSPR
ncbi:MAG: hypothetical protein KAS07_05625 [Candidatus Pacebacteria bacterium]|nr:hypothetical protein [Candidatus Paceibacterota bacterium]